MGAEEATTKENEAQELDDVPDLVGAPLAVSDPIELARQIIRGFCVPTEPEASVQSGTAEASVVGESSSHAANKEIDTHVDKITFTKEESEDLEEEDDDDVIVVETKREKARIVRVLHGLEFVVCAVAILVFTFHALARIGVDFDFQLHPKLDGAPTPFVSIASAKEKLFWNPEPAEPSSNQEKS